jgi:hypothetical protein
MEAVMRLTTPAAAIVAALLAAPVLALAQEPVTSFSQLNTRLKPGASVYVTDARGREIKGKIQGLSADGLTLEVPATWPSESAQSTTLAAGDVSLIRDRPRDSLWNGTLIGLGVGAAPWCIAAAASHEPGMSVGVECLEGTVVFGSIGALIGLAIDAGHGKKVTIYRAPSTPGTGGSSHARLSIAPVLTPRTKGVVVAFSF